MPHKKYFSFGVRFLSSVAGLLAVLIAWPVLALFDVERPFLFALLVGGAVTVCIAVWLVIWLRSSDMRYRDVAVSLGERLRFACNASVAVDDVARNGYLFLTSERLMAYFRDRKPYTKMAFELSRRPTARELSPVCLGITDAGHSFEIVTSDLDRLTAAMRDAGWQVLPLEPDAE